MAILHDISGLKQILGELEFPVGKDRILEYAQDAGADREILSALQSLPPADYNQPEQVLRSVPMDESVPEARSDSEQAYQRRHSTQPGVSEKMVDTPPVNPIEEELGENRKS